MQEFVRKWALPKHGDPSGEGFPLREYFIDNTIQEEAFKWLRNKFEPQAACPSDEEDDDNDGGERSPHEQAGAK